MQTEINTLFQEIDSLLQGHSVEFRLTTLNINRGNKIRYLIFSKPHFYLQLIEAENVIYSKRQAVIVNQNKFKLSCLEYEQKQEEQSLLEEFAEKTKVFPARFCDKQFINAKILEIEVQKKRLELKQKDPCSSQFYFILQDVLPELNMAIYCKNEILENHPYLKGLDPVSIEEKYGEQAILASYAQQILSAQTAKELNLSEKVTHILLESIPTASIPGLTAEVLKQKTQLNMEQKQILQHLTLSISDLPLLPSSSLK